MSEHPRFCLAEMEMEMSEYRGSRRRLSPWCGPVEAGNLTPEGHLEVADLRNAATDGRLVGAGLAAMGRRLAGERNDSGRCAFALGC